MCALRPFRAMPCTTTNAFEDQAVYLKSLNVNAPPRYVELIFKAAGVGEGGGGGGAQLKALKILRLLRLAKMLRLAKIKAVIKRLDEDFPGIFTVSKLSSLVLIIL